MFGKRSITRLPTVLLVGAILLFGCPLLPKPPEVAPPPTPLPKVKTYRTKIVAEGMEILTEHVLPDRTHTKSEMMGMKVETIEIGNITYIKTGDGPWQKEEAAAPPPGAPEIEMPDIEIEMAEEMVAAMEVKEVGVELVEGVECRVYEVRFGEEAELMRYYIGVTDNLPRKMEMGEVTIIFYDYNAPIEINPPI